MMTSAGSMEELILANKGLNMNKSLTPNTQKYKLLLLKGQTFKSTSSWIGIKLKYKVKLYLLLAFFTYRP